MSKTSADDNSSAKSISTRKFPLPFKTIMPLIFMMVGYITDVVYVAINGRSLINSDAAEMMLGRLLNTTGGVITDNGIIHLKSEP